jgi:hypothetical protein
MAVNDIEWGVDINRGKDGDNIGSTSFFENHFADRYLEEKHRMKRLVQLTVGLLLC